MTDVEERVTLTPQELYVAVTTLSALTTLSELVIASSDDEIENSVEVMRGFINSDGGNATVAVKMYLAMLKKQHQIKTEALAELKTDPVANADKISKLENWILRHELLVDL